MFTNRNERPLRTEPRNRAILLSLVLALRFGSLVCGQTVERKLIEPGVNKDNPRACALFEEVANAYKALNCYSDNGDFVLSFKVGGIVQKQVLPMKMTFARPNKLDFDGEKCALRVTAQR